jgi:hypothetical protein
LTAFAASTFADDYSEARKQDQYDIGLADCGSADRGRAAIQAAGAEMLQEPGASYARPGGDPEIRSKS